LPKCQEQMFSKIGFSLFVCYNFTMPPRIERVVDLSAETQGAEGKYFVIDLQEESETFDIDLFHRQVKTVGPFPAKYQGQAVVKYIVVSNRMFIFSSAIKHDSFHDFLTRSRVSGELQSAGDIEINFALFRPGLKSGRRIGSYSLSLAQGDQLPREKSEEYKRAKIKDALGGLFQVY